MDPAQPKWSTKNNCSYHKRELRGQCGPNCPMHGAFDEGGAALELVLRVFGGKRNVFRNLVEGYPGEVQPTVDQMKSVVAAMDWSFLAWRRNPIHGPRAEFEADRLASKTLVDQGCIVGPTTTFQPRQITVPFAPWPNDEHPGHWTVCKIHSGERPRPGGCLDDCFYRDLFPASSSQIKFNVIYGMFGPSDLGFIRSFFKQDYNLADRRNVAEALAWDAESWELHRFGGPRSRCDEQKALLGSLVPPPGHFLLLGKWVKKPEGEGAAAEGDGEGEEN